MKTNRVDNRSSEETFCAPLHYVTCTLNTKRKRKLPLLLDSGSQVNLVHRDVMKDQPIGLEQVDVKLQSATDHELCCLGKVELPLRVGKLTALTPFLVVNHMPYKALLSTKFLQDNKVTVDYGRNVMDFWQGGVNSGAIKLEPDSKAKSLRAQVVSCEVNKVTAAVSETSSESGYESVRTYDSSEKNSAKCFSSGCCPSDDSLQTPSYSESIASRKSPFKRGQMLLSQCKSGENFCEQLLGNNKRLKLNLSRSTCIEPGSSISFNLSLLYNPHNLASKFLYNQSYVNLLRFEIKNCPDQNRYVLKTTNITDKQLTLKENEWIGTLQFLEPASFRTPKPVRSCLINAQNKYDTYENSLEDEPEMAYHQTRICPRPNIYTYKYETYPKAVADGFTHQEIGLIKKRLREKEFSLEDFSFSADLDKKDIFDARNVLTKYKSVFTKNNQMLHTTENYEADFEMVDDNPVFTPPYRSAPERLRAMRTQIQDQYNAGQVEPACSSYNSGVILVAKKVDSSFVDTDYKLIEQPTTFSDEMPKHFKKPKMFDVNHSRMCIDYRQVNRRTKKYMSNIGDVEAAINKAAKHKYAITLDISAAFQCIKLAERCRDYLAFSLPNDPTQWRPTTLPFGHSLSPVLFGKALVTLLGPDLYYCDHISTFVDDILITGNSFEEVLFYLEKVLARLEAANLCVRPGKCQFSLLRFRALGKLIDENGIRIEKKKLSVIQGITPPKTLKQLQAVLGLLNYFRTFIPNYTKILYPIFQLLKSKKEPLPWTAEHQKILDEMKEYLLKEPCMAPYNPDFENVLHTDASLFGLGCVFMQKNPETGIERPVYYLGRTLNSAEKRYAPSELEATAILYGVTVLKHYLVGKPFTVVTDHLPLVDLARINQGNTRLTRIALKLSQYQMDIKYKQGKQHILPDFASRYPPKATKSEEKRNRYYTKKANDLPTWDTQGRIPLCVNVLRLQKGIRGILPVNRTIKISSLEKRTNAISKITGIKKEDELKIKKSEQQKADQKKSQQREQRKIRSEKRNQTVAPENECNPVTSNDNSDIYDKQDIHIHAPDTSECDDKNSVTLKNMGDREINHSLNAQTPTSEEKVIDNENNVKSEKTSAAIPTAAAAAAAEEEKTTDISNKKKTMTSEKGNKKPECLFSSDLISHTDLVEAQRENLLCLQIIMKLEKNDKSVIHEYQLQNGLLMKKLNDKWLIYVPSTFAERIFSIMHDDLFGGHAYFRKIYMTYREQYFTPRLYTKLNNYLKTCDKCQRFKIPNTKPQGLFSNLKPFPGQWCPNRRVYIDFLGPYTKTSRGNKYVCHILDHCTRFAMTRVSRTCTAKDAMKLLEKWCLLFSAPFEITSDMGSHFVSELFQEYVTVMKAKTRFTPSYTAHPNLVERTNQILIRTLRNYVNDDHTNWDKYVDHCTAGYNMRYQDSIGMSPHEAVFGYKPILPQLSDISQRNYSTGKQHFEGLNVLRQQAKSRLEEANRKSTDYMNKKRRPPIRYYPGELVIIKRPRMKKDKQTRKFLKHYTEPYTIVERQSDLMYVVIPCNTTGQEKMETVHVAKIKKYFPQEIKTMSISVSTPETSKRMNMIFPLNAAVKRRKSVNTIMDAINHFVKIYTKKGLFGSTNRTYYLTNSQINSLLVSKQKHDELLKTKRS